MRLSLPMLGFLVTWLVVLCPETINGQLVNPVLDDTEATFIRGDFDGDEDVDGDDIDAIGAYAFMGEGVPPGGCERAGDADDGGSINVTDMSYLSSFLFRQGPPPPSPFPAPGRDPTADGLAACAPSAGYADGTGTNIAGPGAELSGLSRLDDGRFISVDDNGRIRIHNATTLLPDVTTSPAPGADFEGVVNLGGIQIAILQEGNGGGFAGNSVHFLGLAAIGNTSGWVTMRLAGIANPEGIALDGSTQTMFVCEQNTARVFSFPRPNPPVQGGLINLGAPLITSIPPSQARGLHFDGVSGRLLVLTDTVAGATIWDVELNGVLRQWIDLFDGGAQWEGVAMESDGDLGVVLDTGGFTGQIQRLDRQ